MTTVAEVNCFVDEIAPPALAEEWDNVGLLVGDPKREVERIMTCLTVTPETSGEAVDERADVLVVHHPLPFRPLQRITTDSLAGKLLLELIEARIAVISPHTRFDSAAWGINQQLAEGIGLEAIQPLLPTEDASLGAGRVGSFPAPLPLQGVAERLCSFLQVEHLHRVGSPDQSIERVAIGCGSAGEFLGAARKQSCQLLIVGETSFHTCVQAAAENICLLLPGHFASERFGVERLADSLGKRFPKLVTWASRQERDHLQWDKYGPPAGAQ